MKSEEGFTLAELMVTVGVSGIALAAFWSTFQVHHKSFMRQEETVTMQQTVRQALGMIARDTRLGGYDWTGNADSNSSFFILRPGESDGYAVPGSPSRIQVAMDLNSDGDIIDDQDPDNIKFDANEVVSYGFSKKNDRNGDGIANKGAARLGRNTNNGSGFQPMAENIQAIGFAYAFDSDDDGSLDFIDKNNNGVQESGEAQIWAVDSDGDGVWENLDVNGDGSIDRDDLPGSMLPEPGKSAAIEGDSGDDIPVNPEHIRAVCVWLLVRAELPDKGFRNNETYVVGRQVIQANDGFRRRLLSTTIHCRNMGLE